MATKNSFTIEGIEDWRKVPDELRVKSKAITRAGAERAAELVRDAYPRGETGELKAGVKVRSTSSFDYGSTTYLVLSTTIYAPAYEFGSQHNGQRARPTFLPITYREREKTTAELIDVVESLGFTVTGDHS